MCGRSRCTLRPDDIPRACHLNARPVRSVDTDRYRPSYNVSPGSNLPVIRRDDGSDGQGVVLHCMKWGLIPSFTKKTEKPDHFRMFNARSESICEKASFCRLVPNSRCLVAVEGFYEWKKDGSKKQPFYIHFKDGRPLVFAALYDSWKNSEGEILYTFTILTTSSSSVLEWLHDRMPVILGDKGLTDAWLDGSSSSKFDTILKPYEEPDLVWYPVTPAMGKPSFGGPECIKEIQLKTKETKPISSFFSKKGITSEHEANPQGRSTCNEPIKTNQPKTMKEEPETQSIVDHQSFPERSCDNSKSNVSTLTCEGAANLQTKWDYEEFSADAKPLANLQTKRDYEEFSADAQPSVIKNNMPRTSPVRKKGNHKGAGDKQPTLFSYFGKG